jgi:hypothetical protein
MNVIADQLRRQYPKELQHTGAVVDRMRDDISEQRRLLLVALAGAALCILLIACSNLANLLLARALARQKELAVKTALGAGRERLIRQLVTESMVLALLGGLLGIALADITLPLLIKLVPSLPLSGAPSIDLRVLGFAAILTLLTGVGFGTVPALRAGRGDLSGLREGTRSGGARKAGLRSVLILAEVTLSVVLLISAGLLLRALLRVQSINPGFRSDGVAYATNRASHAEVFSPGQAHSLLPEGVVGDSSLAGRFGRGLPQFSSHDDGRRHLAREHRRENAGPFRGPLGQLAVHYARVLLYVENPFAGRTKHQRVRRERETVRRGC